MAYQAPFDASRDFVARGRDLLVAGKLHQPGDPFDKSRITERLLRQLYEQHQIEFAGELTAGNQRTDPLEPEARKATRGGAPRNAAPAAPRAPKVRKPTAAQLAAADALANTDGNTKAKLLTMAEGLETVRKDMNKGAIALELIRAGRGPA